VRQTGLLLCPCVGSVPLLCPCPEGGHATVKLSPNCTPVELNNNHRTLGTHNTHEGPFCGFLSPHQYQTEIHLSKSYRQLFLLSLKCQPPALIHFIFFPSIHPVSISVSISISISCSLSLYLHPRPPPPRPLLLFSQAAAGSWGLFSKSSEQPTHSHFSLNC